MRGFSCVFSQQGFNLAGRHLEFLAYSSSALRQHAVWFMIPFEQDGRLVTAQTVRKSLGDFSQDETKPAKMAARMARKHTPLYNLSISAILIPPLQRRSLRPTLVSPWYEASGKTWKIWERNHTFSRTAWGPYLKNLGQGFGRLCARSARTEQIHSSLLHTRSVFWG